MRLVVLLFCCGLAFGQNTSSAPETKSQAPTKPPDQKSQSNDFDLGHGIQGKQLGGLDILSDTQGVDFGAYLQGILQEIKQHWYFLIPESVEHKKGKLAIEFAVTKDGYVKDMRLVASSGDVALDRPAWGSITGSNPFSPLPSEFTGPYLALRLRFYYNPDKSDLDGPGNKPPTEAAHTSGTAPTPSKSAVMVFISGPDDLQVPAGGVKAMTATVMGTGEKSVEWSVDGPGCSGAACGKISDGLYIAPSVRPNPPVVTLTAVSKADPTKRASITVHIVRPAPETKSSVPANSSDQKVQGSGAQFGSFDGSWEGDLIFLQGATLSQKEQTTARYRISIQGMKVRVFLVRSADVREVKPSQFHVDFLMTNAVVYATDSGHDDEGTWVETWVFTLTQIDSDTVLTNFSRMVNNLDLPPASDHSKFATEAAGKLRRISYSAY